MWGSQSDKGGVLYYEQPSTELQQREWYTLLLSRVVVQRDDIKYFYQKTYKRVQCNNLYRSYILYLLIA